MESEQLEDKEVFEPFEIFFLALFWKMQSYGLTADRVRCLPTLGNTCSKCKSCTCKSPWDNFLRRLVDEDPGIEHYLSELSFKEVGKDSEIISEKWLTFEKDHPGIFQQVVCRGKKFLTLTSWALTNEVPRIVCNDSDISRGVQVVCGRYASRGPDNFFATHCMVAKSVELENFLKESAT